MYFPPKLDFVNVSIFRQYVTLFTSRFRQKIQAFSAKTDVYGITCIFLQNVTLFMEMSSEKKCFCADPKALF